MGNFSREDWQFAARMTGLDDLGLEELMLAHGRQQVFQSMRRVEMRRNGDTSLTTRQRLTALVCLLRYWSPVKRGRSYTDARARASSALRDMYPNLEPGLQQLPLWQELRLLVPSSGRNRPLLVPSPADSQVMEARLAGEPPNPDFEFG